MSTTTTVQTRARPLSASASSSRLIINSGSSSPSPRSHNGVTPLPPPYALDVQAGGGGGDIAIEHRRTGQVHTLTLSSPAPFTRTRLIPIDAVSSSDLAEAANHLLKAEWNELATEGQLLSQNPEVGYGTPLVDRLLPELLTRRLHRARMEVYLYTEVQARREGATKGRPGVGALPTTRG